MTAIVISLLMLGQIKALQQGSVKAATRDSELRSQAADDERALQNAKRVGTPQEVKPIDVRTFGGPDSQTLKTGNWGEWPFMFEVLQVLNKNEMIVKYHFDGSPRLLMLRGFPTKNLADDDTFLLVELGKVTGTTTYETLAGTNTVYVIEPLAKEDVEKLEQAALEAAKAAEDAKYRTWKSVDSEIEGQFIKFQNNRVHLAKRDGTIVEVQHGKLSKEDHQFIREEIKRRKAEQAENAPPKKTLKQRRK